MDLRGCVVLSPTTTGTQLSIDTLVTNQNTKENRSITSTWNNIDGCASENEDYLIYNHNIINIIITNNNDMAPSESLGGLWSAPIQGRPSSKAHHQWGETDFLHWKCRHTDRLLRTDQTDHK